MSFRLLIDECLSPELAGLAVAAGCKKAPCCAPGKRRGPGAQAVEQVEADDELHRLADERWAKVLATGKMVPWNDAKTCLKARASAAAAARPPHQES